VSEASGRPAQGFLGHDFLEQFTLEIDHREQRVRLYDPARYRYAGSGTVVPFASEGDHPLLRGYITVAGGRPIPARLLLDTGASGLCLILTLPFVEQHGLARDRRAIEAPIGTGLTGPLHGRIVRLQGLRIPGVTVAFPTTGLGGERKGFLARTDLDGILGNPLFEDSRLIVDYARHRVIIEPATRPTPPSAAAPAPATPRPPRRVPSPRPRALPPPGSRSAQPTFPPRRRPAARGRRRRTNRTPSPARAADPARSSGSSRWRGR